MNQQEIHEKLEAAIGSFVLGVNEELKDRWNNWKIDLTKKELTEVIFGLMSRQINIVIHYVKAPTFWNGDVAPIVLRSLVDNYINFAWILKDPEHRARQFIIHGLGQAKLSLEHSRVQLSKDGIDPEKYPPYKATEKWISWQRYPFLTSVNIGSWSELNTRKMAEEADCIDLYNYVYQPFSTAAHNMWNHVSRYNLAPSDNPLHNFLLIPRINDWESELNYLELGGKYLAKMLNLFDRTYSHVSIVPSSFAALQREISELEEELSRTSDRI